VALYSRACADVRYRRRCAIPSLCAAAAGARSVTVSDHPDRVRGACARSLAMNRAAVVAAAAAAAAADADERGATAALTAPELALAPLAWGDADAARAAAAAAPGGRGFDVVIGADLGYDEDFVTRSP